MKEIRDIELENKKVSEEEFVVNGEGCLDDCPTLSSWITDSSIPQLRCKKGSPFISKKR